jgi:hypothetical protein
MGRDTSTPTPRPSDSVQTGATLKPDDDRKHVFIAPIYDEGDDRFTFHVYVDETYYESNEDHVLLWGETSTEMPDSRAAELTHHHDGIYRDTVTYESAVTADMSIPSAMITNKTIAELRQPHTEGFIGVSCYGVETDGEQTESNHSGTARANRTG